MTFSSKCSFYLNFQVLLITLLLCFCLSAFAFTDPVLNAGVVKSVAIKDHKINITTSNAFVEVSLYSPSSIRVRMDKEPLKEDFSYAVIVKPHHTNANITQTSDQITITTDSLKAVVGKKPFSIAFYTPDGQIINEDEKGLTISCFLSQISKFNPEKDAGSVEVCKVKSIVINNERNAFVVSYSLAKGTESNVLK